MSLGKKCLQNTKINIFLLNDVYIILRRRKKIIPNRQKTPDKLL